MTTSSETSGEAGRLLTADAVRTAAERIFALAEAGKLAHFTLDMARLDPLADRVVEEIARTAGEEGAPFHACWRNFAAGGHDRWEMLAAYRQWPGVRGMGRAAFDLAFLAALLGAGPGSEWRYREETTGEKFSGAEGLAVATLSMFASGLFSADPLDPLRADATALARLTDAELADGLQVTDDNPLGGFAGRATLLRRLGETVALRDDVFAVDEDLRPGCLFDRLIEEAGDNALEAAGILDAVLGAIAPVWPERVAIDDIPLGDTWPFSALGDGKAGLVPLHAMAQEIAYSLVEPLIWAGVDVGKFDGLTGIADPAHGALFLEAGVLLPRDRADLSKPHGPADAFTVEWRALTVALVDRLADRVRALAGLDADGLPIACVMQGGTLPLARKIALEKPAATELPLGFAADGTVV